MIIIHQANVKVHEADVKNLSMVYFFPFHSILPQPKSQANTPTELLPMTHALVCKQVILGS